MGAVQSALSGLESHALLNETLPIHDALYHLQDAQEEGSVSAARRQLLELRTLLDEGAHPQKRRLEELLALFSGTEAAVGPPRPPSVEEVLEDLGIPLLDGDLPAALRRYSRREAEIRRALSDRVEYLEHRFRAAARAANLLSGASVVLGGLLVIVLLVAMDVIEIEWMEPAFPGWEEVVGEGTRSPENPR